MKKAKYFVERGAEYLLAFGFVTSALTNLALAAAIIGGKNIGFKTVAAEKEA